jgi:putative NIF3 family GTP cyclohydrolase 1 type 2
MKTAELAARLDAFFCLSAYPPADFAEIEEFSREAGIPLVRCATPQFMQRHNGLMLENADWVERVNTLVFPSDQVLDEARGRANGRPTLVFTHHPMDFETSGRGLIPISEATLQRLRDARSPSTRLSFYSSHAPLDCHDSVSTSRALARAAGVQVDGVCAGYHGGYAGVIGTINETTLPAFVERFRAC